LRESERDKELPTFEQAKDQVKQIVLREKYFNAVQQARTDIGVEILDEKLKAEVEATR
jgi:peptidyl-prolyl cis-trans isomerase C